MTKVGDTIPDLTKGRVRKRGADETDLEGLGGLTATRECVDDFWADENREKYPREQQTVFNWLSPLTEHGMEIAKFVREYVPRSVLSRFHYQGLEQI